MSLSNNDKRVLEEIVRASGNCLDSYRCQRCPLKTICLPEFLRAKSTTPVQRLKIAEDILAHCYLIDDEINVEEIQKTRKWDKS